MTKSLVSVCVPVFNHEEYVQNCINSIIAQDYQDIELIIIDDGSSDQSIGRIRELIGCCEKRFKRFRFIFRENRGLISSLNEALAWCRGRYFSILASDDEWLPNKVSLQVEYLNNNHSSAGVFGGIYFIDGDGGYLRTKVLGRLKKYNFEQVLLCEAFLPAPTALLRLNQVKAVGGFNQEYRIEDWYMWLRLTESGTYSLDCLPAVVARYRRHEKNNSKKYVQMLNEQYKIINLYKNSSLYRKSEASLILSAYTALLSNDKLKAISLVPDFLCLWREVRFWMALAKLMVPKSILLKFYS